MPRKRFASIRRRSRPIRIAACALPAAIAYFGAGMNAAAHRPIAPRTMTRFESAAPQTEAAREWAERYGGWLD